MIGERRSTTRPDPVEVGPPAYSRDAAERVAAALERADGWRFHGVDLREGLDDARTFPLVLADGTVVGVGERRGAEPGDHVETILELFAALVETERIAAEALEEASRARREAVHDHLTGLLNRRGWEQALEHEQARASRRPAAWVVAVVDVDHLKETNDRGGHLAGDLLLKLAAETIASAVRSNDVVARIGGDEFAVLGLDYGADGPDTLVHRIQKWLDASEVAASVGAAVHAPRTSLRETFQAADAAMYEAKQARKTREVRPS